MSDRLAVGQRVKWKWGAHWAHGRITERFTQRVTRTIEGSSITRNADETHPAFMVEQEDGQRALKSHSELQADSRS